MMEVKFNPVLLAVGKVALKNVCAGLLQCIGRTRQIYKGAEGGASWLADLPEGGDIVQHFKSTLDRVDTKGVATRNASMKEVGIAEGAAGGVKAR